MDVNSASGLCRMFKDLDKQLQALALGLLSLFFGSCQLCAICIVQRTISAIWPNKAALFLFFYSSSFYSKLYILVTLVYFTQQFCRLFPRHLTVGYWTAAHLKISCSVVMHSCSNQLILMDPLQIPRDRCAQSTPSPGLPRFYCSWHSKEPNK